MSILEDSVDDKNVRKATYDEITTQCCNCLPGSETLSPAEKHFPPVAKHLQNRNGTMVFERKTGTSFYLLLYKEKFVILQSIGIIYIKVKKQRWQPTRVGILVGKPL